MPVTQQQHSPTPSLYEHDVNESLDSMTLFNNLAAATAIRTKSSPTLNNDKLPARLPTTPSIYSSNIPRRVKSTESYKRVTSSGGGGGGTPGLVSQCLLRECCSTAGGGDTVSLDPDVELWLDMIPLSRRPFRNFHREFSDGVLMAELLSAFLPKKVDLHNYVTTSSSKLKKSNWETLNIKVLSKLGLRLSDQLVEGIVNSKPGYIEKALKQVHRLVENMDRKMLDSRSKALSCMASSYDGYVMGPPFVEDWCLVRCSPGEIPDCVIYQNIKYYCSAAFDEVQVRNQQLRERNNELCAKVKRMETLLGLKEAHLDDLTKKIHELRRGNDDGI